MNKRLLKFTNLGKSYFIYKKNIKNLSSDIFFIKDYRNSSLYKTNKNTSDNNINLYSNKSVNFISKNFKYF
jgi:hypothetical protein